MSHQNVPDQPEWLKNHNPPPGDGRGNPSWVKGGPSPNPHGRRAGLGGPRTRIAKLLQDNASGILEVQIKKALEGDPSAAHLVLARVLAPLRANAERVQFDFDPSLPIGRQVEQVLGAIAAGEVPPDVGQTIISAIGTLSNIRSTEELAERLAILEAKAVN